MRQTYLLAFLFLTTIYFSPAHTLPLLVENPIQFFLNLLFKKKQSNATIDLDELTDTDGCLKHNKIEEHLKKLPTLMTSSSNEGSTWESNLRRNLEGSQLNGSPGNYEIIIDNVLQEKKTSEQIDAIISCLKSEHPEMLPLLDQHNTIAFVSNVTSLFNINRAERGLEATCELSGRYIIDSENKRIEYTTTIVMKKDDTAGIIDAAHIHHSAKLNDSGQITLSLENYIAFDSSDFSDDTDNATDKNWSSVLKSIKSLFKWAN